MTTLLAWLLFALGAAHIAYAFIKFRAPLLAGLSAGVVGRFGAPEIRRTAFWFTMFGPLLMLAGQVAVPRRVDRRPGPLSAGRAVPAGRLARGGARHSQVSVPGRRDRLRAHGGRGPRIPVSAP